METLGTLSEGDWCSVGGMHLYQEADFMANFLPLPTEPYGDSIFAVRPTLCPSHESATRLSGRAFCSFDAVYRDSHCSSNVNMDECMAVSFLPNLGSYDYFDNLITARASISTEICETEAANGSHLVDGDDSPRREITGGEVSHGELKDTQQPWGCDDFVETAAANSKKSTSSDKSRKRCQNSEDGNVKNVKRKNKKPDLPGKIDEESHATLTLGQGSACLSEGDSTTRRELSGCLPIISSREPATLNLTGKTRATRGTATDPQSLYARKRRERINERLRILQKLVPNGTKVDISTMLEEAVRYVKFLQLQIRMLSSDELWMYAPISYNGMNIGFDWDTFKPR